MPIYNIIIHFISKYKHFLKSDTVFDKISLLHL